jgi:hypothetical protein
MIGHDNITQQLTALCSKDAEPVIYHLIPIGDFKQRQPLVARKRAEVNFIVFDM